MTKDKMIEKILEDYRTGRVHLKTILEKYLQDTEEREVEIMQSRTIYPKCNCGGELEFNMNYCPECGAKIKWID